MLSNKTLGYDVTLPFQQLKNHHASKGHLYADNCNQFGPQPELHLLLNIR